MSIKILKKCDIISQKNGGFMKDKNILLANGVLLDSTLSVIGEEKYDSLLSSFLETINVYVNNLNTSKEQVNLNNYQVNIRNLYKLAQELGFANLMNILTETEEKCVLGDLNGVNLNHGRIISEINKMISISKQYLNYGSNSLDVMDTALSNKHIESNPVINNIDASKDGIILVVDDSNLVANFVRKIFDTKYNVLIANDGASAIKIVDNDQIRSQIKACLLDLNMPNVNGFDVLEHLKQNNYFVKLPVAIISGVEETAAIEKANSYPIVDILQKPFNERDVQRVVEKCLLTYF